MISDYGDSIVLYFYMLLFSTYLQLQMLDVGIFDYKIGFG